MRFDCDLSLDVDDQKLNRHKYSESPEYSTTTDWKPRFANVSKPECVRPCPGKAKRTIREKMDWKKAGS